MTEADRKSRRALQVMRWLAILGLTAHLGQRLTRPAAPKAPVSACAEKYAPLVRDGALVITVVFGYKDTRPLRFVGDRYERAQFVDRLIAPCAGRDGLCGFQPDPGNAEFFTKKVLWFDGLERTVQIQVLSSSVGPDDQANRAFGFQRWNSERTKRLFRHALAHADVVFYNGHSRVGGGPDFEPPEIYRSGNIKYQMYVDERPGLTFLIDSLRRVKYDRQPKLLGLFSCASNEHFLRAIRRVKPRIGLISSDALLYQADAMTNMVAALESILGGDCEDGFNKKLRSADPRVGSKISGFF